MLANGGGDDRGGLGAQRARAQPDVDEAALTTELDFVFGEPAFGTDDADHLARIGIPLSERRGRVGEEIGDEDGVGQRGDDGRARAQT